MQNYLEEVLRMIFKAEEIQTMEIEEGEQSSCNGEKLIKIEPLDLKFTYDPKKDMYASLYLSNLTEKLVAFKVYTTDDTRFDVQQNYGIILPQTTCGITVCVKAAQKEPKTEMKKFQIQSSVVVLAQYCETEDINQLFNKEGRDYIEEHKLPIVYLSKPLPLGLLPKESYSLLTESRNSNYAEMRELLKIEPQELNFLFEAKKQISTKLQLTNMTENHVAFKVKTTHPRGFTVRPNRGILLPQSTCDVIVTKQAQKALPEVEKSKEKFMIQSATVIPGATEIDADWNLLKDGGVVKEQKLTVVYTVETETEFVDAEGSKEYTPKVTTFQEAPQEEEEQVRSNNIIQRSLRRVSSALDKIFISLSFTSGRSWLFRNSHTGPGVYKRLLED